MRKSAVKLGILGGVALFVGEIVYKLLWAAATFVLASALAVAVIFYFDYAFSSGLLQVG